MSLDTQGRVVALPSKKRPIEFLRVELSPAIDGTIFVVVIATSVEEPSPDAFELLDQELVSDHVPTVEAALVLIGEYVRQAFLPN